MKQLWLGIKNGKHDLMLVVAMVGILVILFMPIPAGLLDFLLVTNFSFALLILLLTFYTDKPLSFSTFPSLLLIATLFRLALNISATRLILNDADAGEVIGAIGSYVVGGNYVIGLVVFLILIVVQYVVVTNGAQRVAEVAARFTLDSMPGKQMSIDADMNMGLIDEHEAKERRANIEKEANFYGAMDGASKFVKGDAIAGIIIILIDIIGGLSIGIAQLGMTWGDALHTYTLLTVGDGIVTQIPSLVIATATGIIITRAATDAQLGDELSRQITSNPKTLVIVAVALGGTMLLPGIPFLPVFVLFLLFAVMAYFAAKNRRQEQTQAEEEEASVVKESEEDTDLYNLMKIDPIEIKVGAQLSQHLQSHGDGLLTRLKSFRKQYAMEFGFVMPEVKVKDDNKLSAHQYSVHIHGVNIASGDIIPDKLLAINPGGQRPKLEGIETNEPTYDLPATWIDRQLKDQARHAGYTLVDPDTVLLTHFSELIKRHSAELLTRAEAERILDRVKSSNANLIDELIPGVMSYSDIQKVLQLLLREKVSIRNIEAILETLLDAGKAQLPHDLLVERVREKLGSAIFQTLAGKNKELQVLTLEPGLERSILQGIQPAEQGGELLLEPGLTDRFLTDLAKNCEQMMAKSHLPVLICSPNIRRKVKHLSERIVPHLSVISLNEIPTTAKIRSFGVVQGLTRQQPALGGQHG
ncbi:MAG: flagellar biosynthesis protein FlhA [Pseudomonadota bacterium]